MPAFNQLALNAKRTARERF